MLIVTYRILYVNPPFIYNFFYENRVYRLGLL